MLAFCTWYRVRLRRASFCIKDTTTSHLLSSSEHRANTDLSGACKCRQYWGLDQYSSNNNKPMNQHYCSSLVITCLSAASNDRSRFGLDCWQLWFSWQSLWYTAFSTGCNAAYLYWNYSNSTGSICCRSVTQQVHNKSNQWNLSKFLGRLGLSNSVWHNCYQLMGWLLSNANIYYTVSQKSIPPNHQQ